ncbi:hypothetical protein KAS08_00310 [Candidatus Pacearchaeota archaeon]|nr:hypothetical protein [Candidatus Pacearchaeota archaeon]
MNKNNETKPMPSLNAQIKFNCKVITKKINMMEFVIERHFGHGTSKILMSDVKLDLNIFIGNVEDASKILNEIKEKDESKYGVSDLDHLIIALSLINRIELSVNQHIANIYRKIT